MTEARCVIGPTAVMFLVLALVTRVSIAGTPPPDPEQVQEETAALIAASAGSPKGGSRDIQSLVNRTGPDGYAYIPAGCYEITDTIEIRDGARIAGAGMTKTVLYRDPAKFKNNRNAIFRVRGQQGKGGTHICGIGFVGDTDEDDTGWDSAISLSSCTDFRIDHCYFRRFGAAAVSVAGESQGLVDHCAWTDIFKPAINNMGYGVVVTRGSNWEDDKELGTAQATFVEDCILMGCRHAIASNAGAHYVFRYNLVRKNVVASSVDAHGLGYGSSRGTRCVEIYENVLEDPVSKGIGIGIRGGDGVIFNNTIKGYRSPIVLILEWGTPKELKSTYPAKDQIRDLWVWNNKTVGGSREPIVYHNAKGFIEKDRDYYTTPKPGYVPYVYPHPLAQGGPFDERPVRRPKRKPTEKARKPDKAAEEKKLEEELLALGGSAAPELRKWVIEGVASGRKLSVYVTVMGANTRARISAADETGVSVSEPRGETQVPWDDVSASQLYKMAEKYAAPGDELLPSGRKRLLEAFALVHGLDD